MIASRERLFIRKERKKSPLPWYDSSGDIHLSDQLIDEPLILATITYGGQYLLHVVSNVIEVEELN